MTRRLSFLFAFLVSHPLNAQAPGPLDGAAETITAPDLLAKIEILAHDSMLGRDTPSPGLERAAAYVAGEFRRLGLRPAGEQGSYVQRYGVSRWTVDTAASSLELTAPTRTGQAGVRPRGAGDRWRRLRPADRRDSRLGRRPPHPAR